MLSQTVLLASIFSLALGHGYVENPMNRNGTYNQNHSGGRGAVHAGGKYIHTMCGSEPQFAVAGGVWRDDVIGPIAGQYEEGTIIEVDINITANHLGSFTVQICDETKITEECFQRGYLMRPGCNDATNPECFRYWKDSVNSIEYGLWDVGGKHMPSYLVKPTMNDHLQGMKLVEPAKDSVVDSTFHTKWQLPEGLSCDHCVMRVHYNTTNNCMVVGHSTPEEFWWCSDISITASNPSLTKVTSGENPAPYTLGRDLKSISKSFDRDCTFVNAHFFNNTKCIYFANEISFTKGGNNFPRRVYGDATYPGYESDGCGEYVPGEPIPTPSTSDVPTPSTSDDGLTTKTIYVTTWVTSTEYAVPTDQATNNW